MHLLFNFNYMKFKKKLKSCITKCDGQNWDDICHTNVSNELSVSLGYIFCRDI